MSPTAAYIRAAAHVVFIGDRAGRLLDEVNRSDRWPYDPPSDRAWLAGWLMLAAMQRLERAKARAMKDGTR